MSNRHSDFKDFKGFVNGALSNIGILPKDIYFSQTQRGYYAAYYPNYPTTSPTDFVVFKHLLTDAVSIHGNSESIFHGIKDFCCMSGFYRFVRKLQQVRDSGGELSNSAMCSAFDGFAPNFAHFNR